ncbi:hypothetical protein [Nonomuraea sp. NPDC050786]|uniref:hypothetical protein n=1 Tax=Nonomuraea sp. NPDC050786 TaxID=3154840 RepID=UPI00340E2F28
MAEAIAFLAVFVAGAGLGGYLVWMRMSKLVDDQAVSVATKAMHGTEAFQEAMKAPSEGQESTKDPTPVVRPLRAVRGQH